MATANTIFERAIALVDGITDTGAVDTTNTADYKARTPFLLNLFQMELIKSGDLVTKYPVAHKPLTNILGSDYYDVVGHQANVDKSYTTESGDVGRVYYFECDGASGNVYIEDTTDGSTWNTLSTVALANTGYGFVPYTALITPTGGAIQTRIRFGGLYFYRFKNFALFEETFSNINRVYNYGRKTKITMPSTCHSVKDIVFKSYDNYKSPDYEIEFNGNVWEILFDRTFDGEVLISYIPNPTAITATDLSDTLTVDDYSANVMAYMLAEAFMNVEQNDYLAGLFKNKYQQLIAQSPYRKPKPVTNMVNVYGTV